MVLSAVLSVCVGEFRMRLLWLPIMFSVIHAAVTDLDGVAIEVFSEFAILREVLVY